MCNTFLFDDAKVSSDEDEKLHFSSSLAGHVTGGYQCIQCDQHIGTFDPEREEYKVSVENLHKEDGEGYHCSKCHQNLFRSEDLVSEDEDHFRFSQPIHEQKPIAADKNNYFKVDIDNKTMSCHGCDAPLGRVTDTDAQTFDAELKPAMIIKKNG